MFTLKLQVFLSQTSCVGKRTLYQSQHHVPTSALQKVILALGSSAAALNDPRRGDMVAVNGEVTGIPALAVMLKRMEQSAEGRRILRDTPVINTKAVDFDHLRGLAPNTFGHHYVTFCAEQNITPDEREPVRYVDDARLAYVMTRYRETHDLTHALLGMPTDLVGEAAVKWVEALQTGLPMCIGAAILGPARFKRDSQFKRFAIYRPWAVKVGLHAEFLMNTYYEERWEQDLDDLRYELNIDDPPT